MIRWTSVIVGALALACSSDGTNDSPFGVGTSATATATATATASGGSSGDPTGSSSGSSSGAAESSSGAAGSTSTDPTTDPTTDATTGVGETGVGETTGMPSGTQPADGLYSHCLDGMGCDPLPALCITIDDMNGTPMDGFCSITPCTNAAVDCVPTPGGTALPACFPVTLDGQATNACALDCSGGATCPTGMTCYTLTIGSICA